jgi:hypothetical protein
MQVHVASSSAELKPQVEQVMRFYLTSVAADIDAIEVTLETVRDRVGSDLVCCRVEGVLASGDALAVTETQADWKLAVTRAMDRSVRTIRRRQTLYRMSRSA